MKPWKLLLKAPGSLCPGCEDSLAAKSFLPWLYSNDMDIEILVCGCRDVGKHYLLFE